MDANQTCDILLSDLKSSNLNFNLCESPFSVSINIKKSFVKDRNGNPRTSGVSRQQINENNILVDQNMSQNRALKEENDHLVKQLKQLEATSKSSKETVSILEEKISKIEASALKSFEERSLEVATYKTSTKNLNSEIVNVKKELSLANKALKEKEKESYRLEQKNENLTNTTQRFKSEMNTLRAENKKLEKHKKVNIVKSRNVTTNTLPTHMANTSTIKTLALSVPVISSTSTPMATIYPTSTLSVSQESSACQSLATITSTLSPSVTLDESNRPSMATISSPSTSSMPGTLDRPIFPPNISSTITQPVNLNSLIHPPMVTISSLSTSTLNRDYTYSASQSAHTSVPIDSTSSQNSSFPSLVDTLNNNTEASTSKAIPVFASSCSHSPQCFLRHPNPPPPFAPLTFDQFYNPPGPPANIRIMPDQKLTYPQYCDIHVSHSCEECEEGSLFQNFTERVEYDDPGPCRGVTGVYLLTCPNHPKAVIKLKDIPEKKWQHNRKSRVKCDICCETFLMNSNLSFHKKRKHV